MVHSAIFALAATLSLSSSVLAEEYGLVKKYQGSSFFDGWDWYNKYDNLTNGNVNYVSAKTASKEKLAYVNPAGNAIMRVDNSTKLTKFGAKRDSVRIQTSDRFSFGSVWVADMLHVPYGCSVWPAWWSHASSWPVGGEIDTFEGVNAMTRATMALHTTGGCTQVSPVQSSTLVNSTDCNYLANSNSGCTVTNPSTASYGAPFAAAGGGVWVTEMARSGISIWFFSRADVPSSLSAGAATLDTSTLGTPVANWPTGGCDMQSFFNAQNLIFDITLCGDYAGAASVFADTCSGVCYQDWVLGDPSAYDNAYFEVQYVQVYGLPHEDTVIESGAHRAAQWGAALVGGAVAAVAGALW